MIDDLLALADRLAKASSRKPRQADLRRSVSTSYYALFHAVARNAADCFVGASAATRANRAWSQAYRALDHGTPKAACQAARNMDFPQHIKDCADAFIELQKSRHDADYDPLHRVTRADALAAVLKAQDAVPKLRRASMQDKRAFAVQVLMKKR